MEGGLDRMMYAYASLLPILVREHADFDFPRMSGSDEQNWPGKSRKSYIGKIGYTVF